MSRPSADEWLRGLAFHVATRSTCDRLHVGVVLHRAGQVLATGYNGAPSGLPHCHHDDDEPCRVAVHAEANALVQAARHGVSVEGAHLVATHAPCLPCSGLLVNAGIRSVAWTHEYRDTAGPALLAAAGIPTTADP